MQAAIHRKYVWPGAVPCVGIAHLPTQPSGHRAMPSEGIQGHELTAYVPLDTYNRDERGIAYGTPGALPPDLGFRNGAGQVARYRAVQRG
jgi:hypothetical protein